MIRYSTSASSGEMDTVIGSWSSTSKTADLPHTSLGQKPGTTHSYGYTVRVCQQRLRVGVCMCSVVRTFKMLVDNHQWYREAMNIINISKVCLPCNTVRNCGLEMDEV